ncbi:MAG: ribosome maturation factor RimM [Bacteroidales bacterium]|nr:ribosome maturation factor RimM [Bacteroidales bacterium]
MDKNDFYFLGKITKTSGYKGNLMFFFDVDNPDYYKNLKSVFIEINNDLIPFIIDNIQFKNNIAFVKLQDITSYEQALILVNCELYLPLNLLPPLKGNKFYFHEIIGFKAIDKKHGNIGFVEQVIDITNQAILKLNYNGKEVLIPTSDEIILDVDRNKKQIKINAPEGLVDIYL